MEPVLAEAVLPEREPRLDGAVEEALQLAAVPERREPRGRDERPARHPEGHERDRDPRLVEQDPGRARIEPEVEVRQAEVAVDRERLVGLPAHDRHDPLDLPRDGGIVLDQAADVRQWAERKHGRGAVPQLPGQEPDAVVDASGQDLVAVEPLNLRRGELHGRDHDHRHRRAEQRVDDPAGGDRHGPDVVVAVRRHNPQDSKPARMQRHHSGEPVVDVARSCATAVDEPGGEVCRDEHRHPAGGCRAREQQPAHENEHERKGRGLPHSRSSLTWPRTALGLRVSSALRLLGRFAVRFRYAVVVAWLVGTGLAINFLRRSPRSSRTTTARSCPRASRASRPPTSQRRSSRPTSRLPRWSPPATEARSPAPTTPPSARAETAIKKVPKVVKIINLGASKNGRASESLVEMDVAQFGDPEADDAVAAVRDTFEPSLAGATHLSLHLTGGVATAVDQAKQQEKSQYLTEVFSSLLILLLLIMTYRSAVAPIVNLIPPVIVLGVAGPIIAESSKIGVSVSSVTQAMLTVLVLGAGTDYGLFLILRVREEIRRGLEPKEAVVEAMAEVGESVTFAALTVVGALLCLLAATFSLYSGLGPGLAIGVGLMALAALPLLPALLAIFGHATFWPKRWGEPKEKTGLWERVGDHVIKHPIATLAGGFLLLGGLALGLIGVGTAGFGSVGTGPAGSDSGEGAAVLEANFPPSALNPTEVLFKFKKSVWIDLSAIDRAQHDLQSAGPFKIVTGPLNPNGVQVSPDELASLYVTLGPPAKLPAQKPSSVPLPATDYQLYRATAQYVSSDGRTVQFATTLTAGDPGSTKALDAVPSIRAETTKVAKTVGAVDSGVSGFAPASYDINKVANDDLVKILPIVLGVIAILLALLVRSLVAPIYLILSVLLSYAAALGLATIIFVHIGGAAGVNFVLPFLLFIFLMALGEDYNILMMARIREEAHKLSLGQAIHRALHLTGTTITSAGVILAGTFAVSGVLGATSQLRQVGWAIALGVLMDTFLVRTLLVPSTALLLGRLNWWPSKLGRKAEAPEAPASSPASR